MKRLAIFAGYNEENIIEDYVIYYIKELKKIADIIYVSNCYFDNNELNKISEYCLEMICKPHGEYDFGSYKKGYIYAKEKDILRDYDYLLFCNDSVFGPFFDLKTIVENMENKNLDAWSIFYCFKDKYNDEHLQSYFIFLHQSIFMKIYFDEFICSVTKETNKSDIIIKYETGLTDLLKKHNHSIGGFLTSSEKGNINYNDDNNLPFTYRYNLIMKGFPFLKKTIIKNMKDWNFHIFELFDIINHIKINYNIYYILNYLEKTYLDLEKSILGLNDSYISKFNKLEEKYILLKSKKIIFAFLQFGNFSIFSIIKNVNYVTIILLGIRINIKLKK